METQLISLSRAEQMKFAKAFSSMPYGAICHFRTVQSVDDVLFNLTALRQVLEGVGQRQQRDQEELDRFHSWIRTAREVLEAVKES